MPVDFPKFPGHPTNDAWEMFDIHNARHPRPRAGENYLLINGYGVLIIGPWREGLRYWAYKPGTPKEPAPEDDLRLRR